MGAGRGGDYGNIKNKVGKFVDNFLELIEEYQISKGGWFGSYSQSTVRHIMSDDPMETMIDFMSRIILHAEIKPYRLMELLQLQFGLQTARLDQIRRLNSRLMD